MNVMSGLEGKESGLGNEDSVSFIQSVSLSCV